MRKMSECGFRQSPIKMGFVYGIGVFTGMCMISYLTKGSVSITFACYGALGAFIGAFIGTFIANKVRAKKREI